MKDLSKTTWKNLKGLVQHPSYWPALVAFLGAKIIDNDERLRGIDVYKDPSAAAKIQGATNEMLAIKVELEGLAPARGDEPEDDR